MRRVITFLGISPQSARYRYNGQVYSGDSFPEALCQFIPFDRMHVFVTEQARAKTLPTLLRRGDPRLEVVDIPDGRSSAEMWHIFARLLSVVEDGDTLLFDITHAFRSIPFFVMLALAFLKSAYENVTIERVLYGEFNKDDVGPIIDLTEFIKLQTDRDKMRLLDGMSAADQFAGFGASRGLVRRRRASAAAGPDAPADRLKLRQLADDLDDVSRTLQLNIPDKAMNAADNLLRALEQAREPMQRQLPPFSPLAERVEGAFKDMALAGDPRAPVHNWRALALERDIIGWYLQRRQLLQAIAVAFEWLLSYIMARVDYETLYHGRDRETVRRQITSLNKARALEARGRRVTAKLEQEVNDARDNLGHLAHDLRLLSLYEQVANLRNDLLHAAKTVHDNPTPAQWEADIRHVCRQLADLPLGQDN
mgnify:CR=1 FL=1